PFANAAAGYWVLGLIAVLMTVALMPGGEPLMDTVGYSVIALLGGLMVASALTGDTRAPLRIVLRTSALRRGGRYFDAMYLFHYPIAALFVARVGAPKGPATALLAIAGGTMLTYAAGAASWRVIERPCLEFRDRFPYPRRQALAESALAIATRA